MPVACAKRLQTAVAFSLSLTHLLKYHAEVTHPRLMLILTKIGKDGKLNIPDIVKLNIILYKSDVRVPKAAGCLFIFMRLTKNQINPH